MKEDPFRNALLFSALALLRSERIAANLLPRFSNTSVSTASLTAIPILPASTDSAGHSFLSNATIPDECWTQWTKYWDSISRLDTSLTSYVTTMPEVSVSYWRTGSEIYTTLPVTTTVTEGNGNFPTTTYVTTSLAETMLDNGLRYSTTTVPSEVTVATKVSTTQAPPACQLPSIVPQCQSVWESYVRNGGAGDSALATPPCTQASITGTLCSTFVSNWLEYMRDTNGEDEGKVGNEPVQEVTRGTTFWPSGTTNYVWPTSSQIVPGCSPGCQSCRVSGNEVKLLYWPPATTTWSNGSLVAITHSSENIVTAVVDGITLTSPSVYISYDRLYASNSCSVVGTTLRNLIVAITNSATLSSLYGWDHYWGLQQTASFNFTDLYVTPVPDYIYNSQPRCASSSLYVQYSCRGSAHTSPICSTFSCARTLPYEPVIAIPSEVFKLQPAWSTCIAGIIGVYE